MTVIATSLCSSIKFYILSLAPPPFFLATLPIDSHPREKTASTYRNFLLTWMIFFPGLLMCVSLCSLLWCSSKKLQRPIKSCPFCPMMTYRVAVMFSYPGHKTVVPPFSPKYWHFSRFSLLHHLFLLSPPFLRSGPTWWMMWINSFWWQILHSTSSSTWASVGEPSTSPKVSVYVYSWYLSYIYLFEVPSGFNLGDSVKFFDVRATNFGLYLLPDAVSYQTETSSIPSQIKGKVWFLIEISRFTLIFWLISAVSKHVIYLLTSIDWINFLSKIGKNWNFV